MQKYLSQVEDLANQFIRLFSEALGLPPDGLAHFYDSPDRMQHRSKLVQYPAVSDNSASDQGVGPHYDAGFVTVVSTGLGYRRKPGPSFHLSVSFCKHLIIQGFRCRTWEASGLMYRRYQGLSLYVCNA